VVIYPEVDLLLLHPADSTSLKNLSSLAFIIVSLNEIPMNRNIKIKLIINGDPFTLAAAVESSCMYRIILKKKREIWLQK